MTYSCACVNLTTESYLALSHSLIASLRLDHVVPLDADIHLAAMTIRTGVLVCSATSSLEVRRDGNCPEVLKL